MTTNHAAPWTFRRIVQMLTGTPVPRRRVPGLMSGREAVARALFSEQVGGSALDLLDYDNSPVLQNAWLAEADRRIEHAASPDRHVAAHFGITADTWIRMSALAKVDHREQYAKETGMAA